MSEEESKECEKAYGEGFKKGSSGKGHLEDFLDGTIGTVVPSTKKWDSHMAGIRDGLKERSEGRKERPPGGGSSYSSSSSAGSSSSSNSGGGIGTTKGWLVAGGFAVIAIVAYGVGQTNRATNGGAQLGLRSGVPVYNLECGQALDVQIPPAMRSAVFVVPPCKCSNLSELNYDCTSWVRVMEPSRHWQMDMRNEDGSQQNECIVLLEYIQGRGPRGISPATPIKVAGCNATPQQESATLRTRENPQGEHLAIPDRFTMQNVQALPIRVRIDFP